MVSQMIFHVMVSIGLLIPSGDVDGRVIYDVYNQDCELVAEYAYKGEIYNYIQTGTFVYNELLEDCCPLIDK
jgi:hypothetical protein